MSVGFKDELVAYRRGKRKAYGWEAIKNDRVGKLIESRKHSVANISVHALIWYYCSAIPTSQLLPR